MSKSENKEPQGKPLSEKKLKAIQAEQEKLDQEMRSRTSRYDQDLKERARKYGINPDNFATEEELGKTVNKYEEDNGILGTPEEKE